MKKKKEIRHEKFNERLESILELASDGIRSFELEDEISIDTLLPDKKNKYVAKDKTLILSNLLSDLACAIYALNAKMNEMNEKVDKLESHFEAFESYVNTDVEQKISGNKELIETTIDNMTTLREKYVKDETDS